MPNYDSQLRALVETFVEQLSELVRRAAIESAVEALRGSAEGPRGRASSPSSTKRPAVPRRERRNAQEIGQTLARVTTFLGRNPGARAEQIKKGLSLTAAQTGDALARLVAAKTVKRKGRKRATAYTLA